MNRPVNEPQASKKVPSPRKAPEMNRKQAKIGHIKEKKRFILREKPCNIYTQKLSPTFLWVSKFYDKLGVMVKNFKITAGR